MSIVIDGVEIPDLPEEQLANYPKAIILKLVSTDGTMYYGLMSTSEFCHVPGELVGMGDFSPEAITTLGAGTMAIFMGQWHAMGEEQAAGTMSMPLGDIGGESCTLIWANHDVYYATAMDASTGFTKDGIYFKSSVVPPPERVSIAYSMVKGYANEARRLSGTTDKMPPDRILQLLQEASKGSKTSWIAEIEYSYITDSEGKSCKKMTSQTNIIHLPREFYFSPSTSVSPVTEAEFPVAKTMDCSFFKNYTGLVKADLPMLTVLGDSAFYGCTALTTVDIPCIEAVPNRAFYGCSALKTINVPAVKTIGEYAFAVSLDGSLVNFDFTHIESIGGHGFYGSAFEGELVLPAAVTIGESAFGQSFNITSVNLPVAKTIGESAFSGCTAIKKIDLGAAEEIGRAAFWSAQMALKTVIIRTDKVCQLAEMREGNENIDVHFGNQNHNYEIYVPAALIDAYKADATWASYPDIRFRAIEDYPDICGTTA